MSAKEQRLTRMRARYHPGRSTISNANSCWHAHVLVRFTTTFIKGVLLFFSESRKNPEFQNFTFFIQFMLKFL